MTVADLKKALEDLDPSLEVVATYSDGYYDPDSLEVDVVTVEPKKVLEPGRRGKWVVLR